MSVPRVETESEPDEHFRLTIRTETEADFAEVDALLDASFGGKDESALVRRIRDTPQYIIELALVAEHSEDAEEARIIGFIMLSYVDLVNEQKSFRVLSLAPLAVLPAWQKKGIGGKLIQKSIELALQRQEKLMVLLGHENYYPRFGFQRASQHKIFPVADWPDNSFMVLKLNNWTPDMTGKIVYPPAWMIE